MNKPWYRKSKQCWYLTDAGRQIRLDPDEDVAFEIWHQMRSADERRAAKNPTFNELAFQYLEFAKRQIKNGQAKQKTIDDYGWYLAQFMASDGHRQVLDLEPQHLTDWLNSKTSWGPSGQRGAITAIKRVMNWGKTERRIAENNLEEYRKPPSQRRDTLVEGDVHKNMILAVRNAKFTGRIDKQFQLVLVAIRHTGGRPQDVARASVEFVSDDFTEWVIPEHKRQRHTMQPKTVYLSPCLQTVTRMLMDGRKSGPLFRGRQGELTVNAIGCRIKRLKNKLGIDPKLIAYSYRHTYITDALTRGLEAAEVAELVGTSIQMIERHYGHLCKRKRHMRNAAVRAMGGRSAE